jgi:hypothetical protein
MTTRGALPTILVLLALMLAACAGSGGGASSTPSLEATGSPLVPESPGGSAAPSGSVGGPVTTPEQAWAAVVATEPRFANITPPDPDLIGQSAWYEVTPASGAGAFIVSVTVGWGDCPSGCIDQHTWQYSVAPDGIVTLQSETGAEPPPDAFPDGGGADAY